MPIAWNVSVKQVDEPLEALRLRLKEATAKIDHPVEIIVIGGAAALLIDPKKNLAKPRGGV